MSWDDLDKAFREATAAKAGTSNFDPIPEGAKVKLAVTKQEFKLVGANATPCSKVTFEVMEGEWIDRKVWHDFWLTGPNAPYLKRDLDTLGWDTAKNPISKLTDPADASLMCLGADVTLGIEEYTGADGVTKRKNIIKFFNSKYVYTPPEKGAEKPAPPEAPKEGDFPF
jgi:hypothetical protein